MRLNKIVFSPTGGVERACDYVGLAFEAGEKIDLSAQDFKGYRCKEDELYLIGVPAFSGRLAQVCRDNIGKLEANGAKAIGLIAYGNRGIDDSVLELGDILIDQGFSLVGGVMASTEHSIFRDYGTGRPDEKDRIELEGFGKAIREKIQAGDSSQPDLPGQRPYIDMIVSTIRPLVGDSCIKCGKCGRSCPVMAIPMDRPNTTENDKCIACMRCIKVCPQKARSLHSKVLEIGNVHMREKLESRKVNRVFL